MEERERERERDEGRFIHYSSYFDIYKLYRFLHVE